MIKLIGNSGSLSENLVRQVFPKKYQNSIFFRLLPFVLEELRKKSNFDVIW